ncbi:MAG TPA: hypothetical protein VM141_08320 [Planctomycetota bacterium]|nr:hypothetical protein [Planctomycetota bacterium]
MAYYILTTELTEVTDRIHQERQRVAEALAHAAQKASGDGFADADFLAGKLSGFEVVCRLLDRLWDVREMQIGFQNGRTPNGCE